MPISNLLVENFFDHFYHFLLETEPWASSFSKIQCFEWLQLMSHVVLQFSTILNPEYLTFELKIRISLDNCVAFSETSKLGSWNYFAIFHGQLKMRSKLHFGQYFDVLFSNTSSGDRYINWNMYRFPSQLVINGWKNSQKLSNTVCKWSTNMSSHELLFLGVTEKTWEKLEFCRCIS